MVPVIHYRRVLRAATASQRTGRARNLSDYDPLFAHKKNGSNRESVSLSVILFAAVLITSVAVTFQIALSISLHVVYATA